MRRPFLIAFAPLLIAAADDPSARMAQAAAEARTANLRAARLDTQARAADDITARTRAQAAALAARIQALEAATAGTEARLEVIRRLQRLQRARLATGQGQAVNLLAAVQTLARRPPILAFAQPGSLERAARVRALLDGMLPELRRQTATLAADVAIADRLGVRANRAAAMLAASRRRLGEERQALALLEAGQRRAADRLAGRAALESDRALAAATESKDLRDLLGRADADAALRDRLASLPGPLLRPPVPARLHASLPPVETPPAPPAAPHFILPVLGTVTSGFGALSSAGIRSRGLTIAARQGALVVSPAAGRIAFAGPFKSFGEIVIVEHGGGWSSLVAGLGAGRARAGQRVEQGSALGEAGGDGGVTVELRHDGEVVDPLSLMRSM